MTKPKKQTPKKKASPKAKKEQPKPAIRVEEADELDEELEGADVVERTEEELVDLTSRVYKLVVERGKDGVLQSEIWKELGLTSRDGSRLAIRLERRGLIGRVKVLEDGRWTYKLTPLRFPTDMGSIERAPCIVCVYESKCAMDSDIGPYNCPWIGPWAMGEFKESQNPKAPEAAPPISV
jgi:hypothetical protein